MSAHLFCLALGALSLRILSVAQRIVISVVHAELSFNVIPDQYRASQVGAHGGLVRARPDGRGGRGGPAGGRGARDTASAAGARAAWCWRRAPLLTQRAHMDMCEGNWR